LNRDILKSTNSINEKFKGQFQILKWISWVVYRRCKILIQDGGSRHFVFFGAKRNNAAADWRRLKT